MQELTPMIMHDEQPSSEQVDRLRTLVMAAALLIAASCGAAFASVAGPGAMSNPLVAEAG